MATKGGTGLGLAISKELVELMGGRMGVVSSEDSGSSFWFELSFEVDEDTERGCPTFPESAELVVLGETDARLDARLEKLAPKIARVVRLSEVKEAIDAVRDGQAPRAILVCGAVAMSVVRSLVSRIDAMGLPEPVDVITVCSPPGAMTTETLADLEITEEEPAKDGRALERCLGYAFSWANTVDPGDNDSPSALIARSPTRIMLAEDNRTNQLVLGRILEHAGHEVEIVSSGDEVVDRTGLEHFGLILLDLNMPGMNGFETIKFLRFSHAIHDLPPIIALTADATDETRRQALGLGFSEYLTKPIEARALIEALDKFVAPAKVRPARPARPAAAERRPERVPRPPPPIAERRPTRSVVSVLDESKIANLVALDSGDGFFAQVVDDYLADAGELIEELVHDAKAGHCQKFRDHAHALKSSSAHVGAKKLFDRCLGWRDLDDHALMLRADAELHELQDDYAAVRDALLEHKRSNIRPTSQNREAL